MVLSGTQASSTTKTGRHDIAEILLKVALNTKNQINHHFYIYINILINIYIIFNTDVDLIMTGCQNNQTLGADMTRFRFDY